MGIFSRGREQRERIAQLERETAALRLQHATVRAKERAISKLLSSTRGPQGSMSSDLYNQAFPDPNKYNGALSLYRAHSFASNDHLRRISRIAFFESPTGAALVNRLSDLVVGAGLKLQAEPMWDMIVSRLQELKLITTRQVEQMLDPEWQRQWRKNVEQRYRLWAKTLQPSYDDKYNLYQIDQKSFSYMLVDGEYFLLYRYAATGNRNPFTIQIIPPENVRNGGSQPAAGNTIENGIEYDSRGAAVAYHIWDESSHDTKRFPRFGPKSGRIFVIHNFLADHEGQRRGVPYLANIIHELTKLGDYEVLEIQAALINALFAIFFKQTADVDAGPILPGGVRKKTDAAVSADSSDAMADYLARAESLDFSHGGVILDGMPPGVEMQSFDTKRPNAGFDGFFQAVKRNLAASKGIPLAAVDLAFNNSYSGARGEILLLWMRVEKLRLNHGWDFEDDTYRMWMWGEVNRGRIEAPGFDYDEILREAYANATWIGNQRPDIDPLKSVNADILNQKYGYRTGHQITAERGGGDYEENLQTIKAELAAVAEANKPLGSAQSAGDRGDDSNRTDEGDSTNDSD